MGDGFEAKQEGRILPSLLLHSTQGHPTAGRLPGSLGAICDSGWRIMAVGRNESSPVPALLGTHLGPGYIAVGEV